MPVELLELDLDALRQLAAEWGEPAFRGNQLYHALYVEKQFDFARMTNLSLALRERLAREASVTLPQIASRFRSQDGSVRYLLRLADGKTIETVWMPEKNRQTLCISSQAGCAVDCHFCATAQLGLIRNLSAGEIIGQVLVVLADNKEALLPRTNVVLMGQGEPLLNYDATLAAVRRLADPGNEDPAAAHHAFDFGDCSRHSAAGRGGGAPKLAVSLNATTDEQRNAIMPINRKYPIAELMAACHEHQLRPWERVTFEYVLLGGFNDTPEDARRLVELTRGLRCKVNLIPWNAVPELPYHAPTDEAVETFQQILRAARRLALIRRSRGQDVFAACGQLALLEISPPTLGPCLTSERAAPPPGNCVEAGVSRWQVPPGSVVGIKRATMAGP
jgi:23S rRNA (adenine2503-C2)-methyltransferase